MTRSLASLLIAACLAVSACDKTPTSSGAGAPSAVADPKAITLPLGDVAGDAASAGTAGTSNPYAHDAKAIEDGKTLFIAMNCAGCHAYGGGGAMGPDLTDGYWRYGGEPAQVFSSISEGRPQGMPAWGKALPPTEIWKVVAYIESISKAGPAAPKSTAAASQAGAAEGTGLGRADRK